MTKESIFEKVREIIAKEASIDKEQVQPDSGMMSDIDLSSIEVLKLVAELEDEFSIRIPEKQLRSLVTVQDFVDFIAENAEGKD